MLKKRRLKRQLGLRAQTVHAEGPSLFRAPTAGSLYPAIGVSKAFGLCRDPHTRTQTQRDTDTPKTKSYIQEKRLEFTEELSRDSR